MNASLSYTHQSRVRANTDPEDRRRYERGITNQIIDMVMEGKMVSEFCNELDISKSSYRRIVKNVLSVEELALLDGQIKRNKKRRSVSKTRFMKLVKPYCKRKSKK